jgi:hypothetical protein
MRKCLIRCSECTGDVEKFAQIVVKASEGFLKSDVSDRKHGMGNLQYVHMAVEYLEIRIYMCKTSACLSSVSDFWFRRKAHACC